MKKNIMALERKSMREKLNKKRIYFHFITLLIFLFLFQSTSHAEGNFSPDELTKAMLSEYNFTLSLNHGGNWVYAVNQGYDGMVNSLQITQFDSQEAALDDTQTSFYYASDMGYVSEESDLFGGCVLSYDPNSEYKLMSVYKYYKNYVILINLFTQNIDDATRTEMQDMYDLVEPILDGGIYEGNGKAATNKFTLTSDYDIVVDSGESFINMTLRIPEEFNGSIKINSQNQLGEIEGFNYDEIIEVEAGDEYDFNYTFNKEFSHYLYDTNIRNSIKEMTVASSMSGDVKLYVIEDILRVEFIDQEGEIVGEAIKNVGITSTPIFLVHGFTGDQSTWQKLAVELDVDFYTTIRNEYYFDSGKGQDIPTQSKALYEQIHDLKSVYFENNIYIEDVDIVSHSMGGLISRYMIQNYETEESVVRKLIMVGTPNHGTSAPDALIGWLGAVGLGEHEEAAKMLYANSDFMYGLNEGELTGAHLHPEVQYGIIYGTIVRDSDIIVSKASALLEGVLSYELENAVHSPALLSEAASIMDQRQTAFAYYGYESTSITEDPRGFKKIKEWLEFDIGRISMSGTELILEKVEGELHIVEDIDEILYDEGRYEAIIKPLSYLETGKDGYSVLSIMQNSGKVAEILVNANTKLNINFISASNIDIDIYEGSARFISASSGYHFAVSAGGKETTKRYVSLDTDFIVCIDEKSFCALSNEGEVMGLLDQKNGYKMEILETGDMLKIDDESIELIAEHKVLEDEFWKENGIYSEITGFVENHAGETNPENILTSSLKEGEDDVKSIMPMISEAIKNNRVIQYIMILTAIIMLLLLILSIVRLSKGKNKVWIIGIIISIFALFGISIFLSLTLLNNDEVKGMNPKNMYAEEESKQEAFQKENEEIDEKEEIDKIEEIEEEVETFIYNISVVDYDTDNDIEEATLTINGTSYTLQMYNNALQIPVSDSYEINIEAEGFEIYNSISSHEEIDNSYNVVALHPVENVSEVTSNELARLFLDVRDYNTDDLVYYNIIPISNCSFDTENQELIAYDTVFSFTVEGDGYPPLDVLDLELSWFETNPVIYLKLTSENAAN